MRLIRALQCMKVYMHAGLGCEHVLLTGRQKEKKQNKKTPTKNNSQTAKIQFSEITPDYNQREQRMN